MYVPTITKPSKKASKQSYIRSTEPTGTMDSIREDLERLKDELVKRNRDQDDALYNLTLGNFSADTRKKLDSLLNKNTETENGGSE
jgi:hypothetical protein